MADPTLYSPSAVYPRRTFIEIQESVGRTAGLDPASMKALPLKLLKLNVNDTVSGLMHRFPSIRGLGQHTVNITISAGDSATELPVDFFKFQPGAFAVLLDENGKDSRQVQVMEKSAIDKEIRDGRVPPYEDRGHPFLFLFGQSTNLRRIIGVFPTDSTEDQSFRIDYLRKIEELVNNGDTLEAPPEFNVYINFRAAALYWSGDNEEKADRLQARADKEMKALMDPQATEIPRPTRFQSFEEGRGYESFSSPNNQLPV